MIYICIFICIELFLSIVVSFSSSVLRHNVLVLAVFHGFVFMN